MKKVIWWVVGILVAVVGFVFYKKNETLKKQKAGQLPLTDEQAKQYLQKYADLIPYYAAHPHLEKENGNVLNWARMHYVRWGIPEGRSI